MHIHICIYHLLLSIFFSINLSKGRFETTSSAVQAIFKTNQDDTGNESYIYKGIYANKVYDRYVKKYKIRVYVYIYIYIYIYIYTKSNGDTVNESCLHICT
jgi:hypothetical protein